jgi:hypothetical protein
MPTVGQFPAAVIAIPVRSYPRLSDRIEALLGGWLPRGARSRITCVQVTVWYFADCPNWRVAGQRLRQALDELGRADVPISFTPVETDAEAAELGFAGSPTFTVDGDDLFGTGAPAGMPACRIYPTPAGLAGVPEVSDLVAALTTRVGS